MFFVLSLPVCPESENTDRIDPNKKTRVYSCIRDVSQIFMQVKKIWEYSCKLKKYENVRANIIKNYNIHGIKKKKLYSKYLYNKNITF